MYTQNNETVLIPFAGVVTSLLIEEGKEYLQNNVDNVLQELVSSCSSGDVFQAIPFEEDGKVMAKILINGKEHKTVEVG